MRFPAPVAYISLLLHFSTLILGQVFGDAPCYYANGTMMRPSEVRQCSTGVSTICCTINRPNPPGNETTEAGWTQDECLPNGLCQNRAMSHGKRKTAWWVEYCTNPDVTSTDCLDICRSTRDGNGGSLITPCGEAGDGSYNALDDERETTRWCCGGSDACCTNNIGVIELPRNFTGRAIASSTSTSTVPPTSTSTTPPTTTRTSSQVSVTSEATPTASNVPYAENDGLSSGAKAGIGIGTAVGIIAILLAAFFGHKAYEYRKLAIGHQHAGTSQTLQSQYQNGKHGYTQFGVPPAELHSPPAELPHTDPRKMHTELPTS